MRNVHIQHIANLLRSCSDQRCNIWGKVLHGAIVRTGLSTDTYLCNRLMDFYIDCDDRDHARQVFREMAIKDVYSWNTLLGFMCKKGDLQEAHQLFDEMPERAVLSWNNMISALVRNGCEERAMIVYKDMLSEGFLPNRFTLASVLSACSKLQDDVTGVRCHGIAVKIGIDKNIFVGNALLSMYAKCGLMVDHGVQVFETLSKPNEVSFTAVIGGLARENRVLEAVHMFKLMREKEIRMDTVCLSNILSVCAYKEGDDQSEISRSVLGKQIHSLAVKLGFLRDLHLNNSLLEIYAKNKDMDDAEQIFAEIAELNVVSWNIMISGFGQNHQSFKSVEYFERMKNSGFEPNEVTCINVLGACFSSEDVETSRAIFNSIQNPSISVWNVMLSGYSKCECYEEAINLFRQMQASDSKPDRTTLSVVLSLCTRIRSLKSGKQIHAVTLKAELFADSHIVSGLIAFYSECGRLRSSESIFDLLTETDTACWNSIIAGFSRDTQYAKALMFVKKMYEIGVNPNGNSYAILLGICSRLSNLVLGRNFHGQIVKTGYCGDAFVETALVNMYCKCGEVDSARKFFNTVSRRKTIIWNEMLHGYARNGGGEEALRLYREMVMSGEEPDTVTYVSVLTACSHSRLVDEAIEIFNLMRRDHGVEPELDHYICIIDCLGRAGRLETAEKLAGDSQYENIAMIWELLLSSCRIHGDVRMAKRVTEKLICLDPQNSAPYALMRSTYSCLNQWDEAVALQGVKNKNQVVKNQGISWISDINGCFEDDIILV